MNNKGFINIVVIALIVIIAGAAGVFLYQQRMTKQPLSGNTISETDDSQKLSNNVDQTSKDKTTPAASQNSGAKLVYRVGRAKFNAGANCDETIELFRGTIPVSTLLDNCKAEVGVIGWMTATKLLTLNLVNQKTFSEFDIESKTLKEISINIPLNFIDSFTAATTQSGKLIAKLVRSEPKLLEEVLKHNWRLVDLRMSDKNVMLVVLSLERNASGFYVYSYNRSTRDLQQKFFLATSVLGDGRMYLLNDREIVFSQLNQTNRKQEVLIAKNDGTNQRKLNDQVSNIGFIGEGFIGSLVRGESQYKISIFDVEKNTSREMPLNGITPRDSKGYTVDVAILDFSKQLGQLVYKTHIIGSPSQCALYVFDLKSGKNTKLTDRCFINDVGWSE